jgi:hypothetical protein
MRNNQFNPGLKPTVNRCDRFICHPAAWARHEGCEIQGVATPAGISNPRRESPGAEKHALAEPHQGWRSVAAFDHRPQPCAAARFIRTLRPMKAPSARKPAPIRIPVPRGGTDQRSRRAQNRVRLQKAAPRFSRGAACCGGSSALLLTSERAGSRSYCAGASQAGSDFSTSSVRLETTMTLSESFLKIPI